MNQNILLSLIVATVGRVEQLRTFLGSIDKQIVNHSLFEVIIIDQNPDNRLLELIEHHNKNYSITHVKTSLEGVSVARNLGISLARGEYLAFPDDDCYYYEDTIATLLTSVIINGHPDLIIGRIIDRSTGRSLIKPFPNEDKIVLSRDFYHFGSAIVIFTRSRAIYDNNFGPGAKYFSNEDPEYLYRLLNEAGHGLYNSKLHVWHAESETRTVSYARAWKYGIGMGAMFRKHLSLRTFALFLALITYHNFRFMTSMILLRSGAIQYVTSNIGRVVGFVSYK